MASDGLVCMGAFVGLSGPLAASALRWKQFKPMRDEMKPEGHTCDQEMHDMMGTPLTSWHGHRRVSFAIAVLRLPWRRKRLADHLGHGVLMSQEHMK